MLTAKQQSVLNCIKRLAGELERQPTLAEVAVDLGLRESGIHKHVRNLIAAGYLLESAGKEAYALPQAQPRLAALPLLGVIAAGKPIEAIAGIEEIDLAADFCKAGRYVLRVSGDSMIEAGILHDDYVVVREQAVAERGQIVVALIGGAGNGAEATLKYFHPLDNGQIELRPANASMQPMVFAADEVTLQGVVVGSLRHYGGAA